jgi:hypothetical protein
MGRPRGDYSVLRRIDDLNMAGPQMTPIRRHCGSPLFLRRSRWRRRHTRGELADIDVDDKEGGRHLALDNGSTAPRSAVGKVVLAGLVADPQLALWLPIIAVELCQKLIIGGQVFAPVLARPSL